MQRDMVSLIGKRLSHYRVLRRIGAGGVGVVYQARDVRLERDVALKVLAAGTLRSQEARKRFRREARALSSLNHPNIATVYDFDTEKRLDFLVMELIQGVTLGERLEKGPMPGVEALGTGLQIAEALEIAHGQGVIHRDLKPGNVMVTASGLVKVLDFGLARHAQMTSEPDAMGTPGYASPEQMEGRPQDARADIFAFGCVLFECLAGERAFEGETAHAAIAAALTAEPRWSALPEGVPWRVRNLLVRCLEKDQRHRLPDIREARSELEAILGPRTRPALAPSEPTETPHNLPRHGTSFIGRVAETAACVALLSETRLLTLTGAGGCGKTRLALRVAEETLGDYPDGVWFVDLAPLREEDRVLMAVASAAGIREEAHAPLLETLRRSLGEKSVLLVLDNCEYQVDVCAEVIREILTRCPRAKVLAASRENLRVPGERTYVVPPLQLPRAEDSNTNESLVSSESVRLFVDRASRARPQFVLSRSSLEAIAAICRKLDGIPLAIELAASRVAVLSPEEIRSKLDQGLRLLTGGSVAAPARHQTLAATIEWSYAHLTPDEKRLFRELSVFAGGWTFHSASSVCGGDRDEFAVLDLFTHLLDKSLVIAETGGDGAPRYRLLETIREYALAELERSGEEDAIRGRHLDHFLSLAEEAAPKLTGPEQASWLARLGTEHENLLEASRWGERPAMAEKALRLAASLWRFWIARGYLRAGRQALDRALRREGSPRSLARAEALNGAGAITFHQGEWAEVEIYCKESLDIFSELGSAGGMADALIGLGNSALAQGNYAAARSSYAQALAKFREIGNQRGIGVALSNAGRAAELEGDLTAASTLYEEGLKSLREAGDLASAALRLSSLGQLSLRLGDRGRARDQLMECLALVQDLEEKRSGPYALERTGALLEALGDAREAALLWAASDALRGQLGSPLTPRERAESDAFVGRLRDGLGEAKFSAAWSEGRMLPFGSAVERALSRLCRAGVRGPAEPRRKRKPPERESTRALLQEVRGGDSAAVARLVNRYLPVLRRWAHGRLPQRARDLADTDDLVQVALIRGLGRVQTFEERGTGAFFAYMRQILRNQVRDEIRRRGKTELEEIPADLPDGGASPLEEAIGRESLDHYDAALATLPRKQREGVVMRLEMGLSYREIAEALGSPSEEAARISVRRALERLRRRMPDPSGA